MMLKPVVTHRPVTPAIEMAIRGPPLVLDERELLDLQRTHHKGLDQLLRDRVTVADGQLGPDMVGLMAVGLAVGVGQRLPGLAGGLPVRVTTLSRDRIAIMVVDGTGNLVARPLQEHRGTTGLPQIGNRDDLPVPVLDPTARHGLTGFQKNRWGDTLDDRQLMDETARQFQAR